MEGVESASETLITSFYSALATGDVATLGSMVTEDLEWRFHGPPSHQHLMRMLTGADRLGSFTFSPTRICTIGDRVFAEGKSVVPSVSLSRSSSGSSSTSSSARLSPSSSSRRVTGSSSTSDEISWVHIWTIDPINSRIVELNECFNTSVTVTAPASCNTLWQSQSTRRSMPGLVFAM